MEFHGFLWAGPLSLAISVACTGCLAGRQGGMTFPASYDVAPVVMSRGPVSTQGMHYAGSLSWASASPNPNTPIDVGIGYQLESFSVPEEMQDDSVARTDLDQSHETRGSDESGHVMHGPTLQLGYRLAGTKHKRIWLAARGELLRQRVMGQVHGGVGAVLRLSGEWFLASKSSNHVGAVAVGTFLEMGARELPNGKGAFVALSGLTFRVPLSVFK